LAVLLSLALVVPTVAVGIVSLLNKPPEQEGQDFQAMLQQDYDRLTSNIEQLEKKLAEDSSHADTRKALANLYFERASYAVYLSMFGVTVEAQADYQKAVDNYQAFLEAQQERPTDVLLRLAYALWRVESIDLSEATYQELLEREPENIEALTDYGRFLLDARENKELAIAQWEKAKSLTEDAAVQEELDQLIQQAQGQDQNTEGQDTEGQNTGDQNTESQE
jgi:tetratricopeptide (TPR) repeat protein